MRAVCIDAFVPYAQVAIEKERNNLMKGYSKDRNMFRDDMGMAHTTNMIMQSARNLALFSNVTNPNQLDKISLFFSNSDDGIIVPSTNNTGPYTGLPNAQAMKTVSAIDISIKILVRSLIPVMCMEREMPSPAMNITWLGDKAKNDAGGFKAGETVLDPTAPESAKIHLSDNRFTVEISDSTSKTIQLNKALFKGFIKAKSWDGSSEVYSEETDRTDGTIRVLKHDKSEWYTGTINYDAGIITFNKELDTNDKIVISGFFSRLNTPNAQQVLRVTQTVFNKHVEAQSVSIIGETSIEQMMYMNKVLTGSQNIDMDNFYKDRLVNIYSAHVNNRLMELAFMLSSKYTNEDWKTVTLDYSSYTSTIQATVERKYDGLNALVLAVDDKMRRACNHRPTAYIVGSKVANLMQGDKASFVDAMLGEDESQNGLIGAYNKIPVYRHLYIDEYFDTQESNAYGHIVAVYRRTDGEWAPFIYGEFLGLFVTGAVQNYDNPAELEQALFCQVAIDIADEKLCQFGRVKMESSIKVA